MKTLRAALAALAALALLAAPAAAQVSAGDAAKYPRRNEEKSKVTEKSVRATFKVEPGQSVQAAVDRARPGDLIQIMPGTYHEAVVVDFDDIEIAGTIVNGERPIFDGEGKLKDGVQSAGNNFTIRDLEFRNYTGNGVVVNQAKNASFIGIVCQNTGIYGVYPVLCDGVLVDGCVVSGVWDAGIYAGQCKNVTLQNNVVFNNTIGLETENTENALFYNNTAFDNSLGILVVLLPDLPTKTANNARVINNYVFDNNYPNKAPADQLVSGVEPGTGIAIAAADTTEVTQNEIRGNKVFGITVTASTDSFPPDKKLDIEPNPDGNHIHHNRFKDNGTGEPGPRYKARGVTKGGDLFWSGKGKGNGWNEETKATVPEQLPAWTGGLAGGAGK